MEIWITTFLPDRPTEGDKGGFVERPTAAGQNPRPNLCHSSASISCQQRKVA